MRNKKAPVMRAFFKCRRSDSTERQNVAIYITRGSLVPAVRKKYAEGRTRLSDRRLRFRFHETPRACCAQKICRRPDSNRHEG